MLLDDLLQNLSPELTLAGLPSHGYQVSPETWSREVADFFDKQPQAPGVVVCDSTGLAGVVSRAKFMERLSHPFGLEIYMQRSIRLVLHDVGCDALVLPGIAGIQEGATAALSRTSDAVFEPIVVDCVDSPERWRLLDVHTLLLAQSGLLSLANDTIQKQKEAAEAANRAKSQFLANMSHEIRTPLTAILGFAENLLEGDVPDAERKGAVRTIVRNGEHLLELINDILDLSKIEAGHLEVELLEFSPAQLLSDVVSVMQVRAGAKGLSLKLSFDTPIPTLIRSDPTRVRQILLNLVGNAIKFTQAGSVHLRARLEPADEPRLRVSVVDTGIGLDAAQLGRLFQPFAQADESMTRRFGGTGLGLAISRRLARKLGGDVDVVSAPGQGSTFSMTVVTGPLANVPLVYDPRLAPESSLNPGQSPEQAGALKGNLVLLAEDSPDNQLLISGFLRKCGAEVVLVENGSLAVERAMQSRDEGRPFDVVLMDMQMPVLDGYQAVRELRSNGYAQPIIALTASAMGGDQERCRAIGCDDYATKPLNRKRLLGQILTQVARERLAPDTEVRRVHHPLSTHPVSPAGPAEKTPPAGAPVAAVPVAVTQVVPQPAAEDVFNPRLALERMDGDPELLRQIAGLFQQYCEKWLDEIQRGIQNGDMPVVRRVSHTLKGSADNLGARRLVESAQSLESLAINDRRHAFAGAYTLLAQEARRLSEAVERYLSKP